VVASIAQVVTASGAVLLAAVVAATAINAANVVSHHAAERISASRSIQPEDAPVAIVGAKTDKLVQAAPAAPAQRLPANDQAKPLSGRQADADIVLTLVRSVMLALHHANVTGNYTVLRDISAPSFRDKNSAADLSLIFAPVRDAKIDLSRSGVLDPHITKATLNEQKMLYLVGALETKPLPVGFEMLFEPLNGNWQLFGIAVKPIVPQAPAISPSPKAPQQSPGKATPR
jgi:hypothetical protein